MLFRSPFRDSVDAAAAAGVTAIVEPDAGLITAVQPVHLEGLGTLENVAKAKGELFVGLSAKATAVVNLDDAQVVAAQANTMRTLWDGGADPASAIAAVTAGDLTKVVHSGNLSVQLVPGGQMPAVWSYWEPSPEERAAIAAGAKVRLSCWGMAHPPVSIGVDGVEERPW